MDIKEIEKLKHDTDIKFRELFEKRLKIADSEAEINCSYAFTSDREYERKLIAEQYKTADEAARPYIPVLFPTIFELIREYRSKKKGSASELADIIDKAAENTPKVFPGSAVVACQGTEGAYSQLACEKLFEVPDIMYFKSFDMVFSSIEKGLCRYGILPIENSTAGSVNKIYDLMIDRHFYIVKSVRLKINHSLLVNQGTEIGDIREIISHEQALNQCTELIKSLGNVKITECENTAEAAKQVAESGRKDFAAISSSSCAELYGLDSLVESVQDNTSNYTRFICISKIPEIYPGADRTSLMMILPNKPGSLYRVLSHFNALNINLTKLESRPLVDRSFEFMFYFDFETSVYSKELRELLYGLSSSCDSIRYLGSYSEVI